MAVSGGAGEAAKSVAVAADDDGRTSMDSLPSRPSSAAHWGIAKQSVKHGIKMSSGFATLRDMGDTTDITLAELKPVRKLGEGAFAVVEEADYVPTTGGAKRRVAVKKLKPEVIRSEADVASFIAEIKLLRKLYHKRIVEYIGVGSVNTESEEARRKSLFLVQEFMDGGTLKRIVSKQMIDHSRHIYSFDDAYRWCYQMADGLEYLHSANPCIIHRDLKLENILMKGAEAGGKAYDIKIADFGLVAMVLPKERGAHVRAKVAAEKKRAEAEANKAAEAAERKATHEAVQQAKPKSAVKKAQAAHLEDQWTDSFKSHAHAAKAMVAPQQLSGRTGSYMYMAPEMYKELAYSEKVDVFSFGVIMYELMARYQMVCAVSNLGSESEIEQYAEKVSQGYRPPIPQNWPEPLRELVADCWHQEPETRPTMSRIKERLQKMMDEGVPQHMTALLAPTCACIIC